MKQEQGITYGQPNEWQASQMVGDHGKDKHTSRNPLAAALIVPFLMAACSAPGGAVQEANTPKVIGVGGESPAPIMTPGTMPSQSESPSLSPTPSTEASATPNKSTPTPEVSPTPAPFDLDAFIKGKHPSVTANIMTASVNKAMKAHPDHLVNPKYFTSGNMQIDLGICNKTLNPLKESGKILLLDRYSSCQSLALATLGGYVLTEDPNYLDAFKRIYNYTISPNGVGKSFKGQLDKYLKAYG